jgi:hypothetical protein
MVDKKYLERKHKDKLLVELCRLVKVRDYITGQPIKVTVMEAVYQKLIDLALNKDDFRALETLIREARHNGVQKSEVVVEAGLSMMAIEILKRNGMSVSPELQNLCDTKMRSINGDGDYLEDGTGLGTVIDVSELIPTTKEQVLAADYGSLLD